MELGREREHALFSVETVGALSPSEIVLESLKVLREKCTVLLNEISEEDEGDVKVET